jgi:hypothetical protein
VKNLVNQKNQLMNHSGTTTKDVQEKNLVTGQFAKVECPFFSVPNRAKDILLFAKFSDFVIWFENRSSKEETREEEL